MACLRLLLRSALNGNYFLFLRCSLTAHTYGPGAAAPPPKAAEFVRLAMRCKNPLLRGVPAQAGGVCHRLILVQEQKYEKKLFFLLFGAKKKQKAFQGRKLANPLDFSNLWCLPASAPLLTRSPLLASPQAGQKKACLRF